MMQKRTLYSLLLTSFILVFAFASASAQVVTIEDNTVARCQAGQEIDIMVTNSTDISAFEIILEVDFVMPDTAFFTAFDFVWDPGLTVCTTRVVDITAHYDGTPDTLRIAGMLIADDACLVAPTNVVVGKIVFTTNDVCDGTIELNGIDYVGSTACGCAVNATTQFVDCATTALITATVETGTVTVQNQAPTIAGINDSTLHFNETYLGQASASDLDEVACEELTFSKGTPAPANLVVNGDGSISWGTTGPDVGSHDVWVVVTDKCGATDSTKFVICVENTPPVITCEVDWEDGVDHVIWGDTATGLVSGFDSDGGPNTLVYSVVSFECSYGCAGAPPTEPTIHPGTGIWTWPTVEGDNDYIGTWKLCLKVSDGGNLDPPCAPENADTCCVFITVIPTMSVYIEKTHKIYQGQFTDVSIYLDSTIQLPNEMGGFDFLVQYDASALTFQSAELGALLDTSGCAWEYFTYRYGPNGNCGPAACPSGFVRMIGIAETNNGANHPECFSGTDGQLVSMNFLVTNDRTYECQYIPIRWSWYDCGDNTISSKSGDTLFMSRYVFDYYFDGEDPGWIPIHETLISEFPTNNGAQEECLIGGGPDKPYPLTLIDFYNGGVDIACADSIDDRGDLNLNGLAYEIADAVLYSNFFVYGPSVLGEGEAYQARVAASDANADGIPLSVGDLVYMIRVIVGDAMPYNKNVSPIAVEMVNNNGRLSINSDVPMGAALIVAEGNVSPVLLTEDMELLYAYDASNDQTRALVYSLSGNTFTGEFLDVQNEVVTMEIATFEGHPVKIDMIPANFALAQNFPNPFNPTTTIAFDVPVATAYTMTIYNINGQEVKRFDGNAEAGVFEIEWNASDVGSGVYFYRLEAGAFSDTKKMVLVK
ncbi:MAG: T9SS type A sorting domain-containing protein [candidate division Zixibacteria bacterium]|nr:T9SS type A sorting domain-containing protein [candidate division Zixibacteria bacterium]